MALEGQQLGHYRILRQIGQGGMGEVYLAEDVRIGRQVAIKVMRSERSPYPNSGSAQEAARLFQREMKALSLLDHPHILSLYDFGEEQVNNSKLTYIVMPYRSGGSLTDWLAQRRSSAPLAPQDVGHLIMQAADALQHAHSRQIIHQDVKPSNFLVHVRPEQPNRPDLFLTDFGVAKIATATTASSNTVRGTALYMAPEQWSGAPLPATDQYALAAMAYQLLAGVPPFQGTVEQVMYQHLHSLPRSPSTINPRLSRAIDMVLLRALAKKPEERFPSVIAFANAFQQALAYHDLQATLTLTATEAWYGVSRIIMVPGRRQVAITIPPNTQSGQALSFPEFGEPYYDGGPRGPLILTISIASTDHMPTLPAAPWSERPGSSLSQGSYSGPSIDANATLPAASTASMLVSDSSMSAGQPGREQQQVFNSSQSPERAFIHPVQSGNSSGEQAAKQFQQQFTTPTSSSLMRRFVLIAVALLVILGSIAFVATIRHNTAVSNTSATTTAQRLTHNEAGTATAQASAKAVSAAKTATAVVQATAVAATATATFQAKNADPYQPVGTLAFVDPLSQPNWWNSNSNTSFGGTCQFQNGAYHITQLSGNNFYTCAEAQQVFSNFAFEVQMTITRGDCGGMIVRSSSSIGFKFYRFEVCEDGSYSLYKYVDSRGSDAIPLTNGTSSAIKTGLKQVNILAIVANGSKMDLYVNHQQIGSASDNSYSQGYLGMLAHDVQQTTEVVYANARVWTL
jgi:serine/threonine protein kinase